MTESNIEIVKSLYDAFRRRDVAEIMSRVSEDAQVVQSTELPWGGSYEAPNAFMKFFSALTSHVTSTLVFERFLDAGDHVVAIGRTQGTIVATGAPFDVPVAHVWELRAGKVIAFRPYIDNPTMLAALAKS